MGTTTSGSSGRLRPCRSFGGLWLGGVPMMVGTGVGSEIRQPLGYAIVGGLALSQILTLYTTPVVYIYLDRLQTWLFGEKKIKAASGHAEPAPAE